MEGFKQDGFAGSDLRRGKERACRCERGSDAASRGENGPKRRLRVRALILATKSEGKTRTRSQVGIGSAKSSSVRLHSGAKVVGTLGLLRVG